MVFTDQMQREVRLPAFPPRRIVSLVPSQTELLFNLGLGDAVVGITKFCVHPKIWFESKQRVGGTKTLNINKIKALEPDLIIGNKEENEQGQIETLAALFPIWMSDVSTLEEALDMIRQVGKLCEREAASEELAGKIQALFRHPVAEKKRTAYLIWRKPYMAAGGGTFIDDMMAYAGFENVFGAIQRYPEISLNQLQEEAPEIILLSSEPYPFQEKYIREFQEICPEAKVMVVDGEMFSWYGSRLLLAADYLNELRSGLKVPG